MSKIQPGLLCLLLFTALIASGQDSGFIVDNSFLIEEAYNQEAGVIQHINVMIFDSDFRNLEGSFTEEWPLGGMKNQLSVTVPYGTIGPAGFRVRDIFINYRYQLAANENIYVAPRISLEIPSGKAEDILSGWGYQLSLPVSIPISKRWMANFNAGYAETFINPVNNSEAYEQSAIFNTGGSIIFNALHNINFLLEATYNKLTFKDGDDQRIQEDFGFINPGIRYAVNFKSGLQLVPGISFPTNYQNSSTNYLFYLSVEHAYKK